MAADTQGHGRNLVGVTGDVSPHFFRRGGHNMPCPLTFLSLGFVVREVSKIKVMFVAFYVKRFQMLDGRPHIAKLMLKQSLVWYH